MSRQDRNGPKPIVRVPWHFRFAYRPILRRAARQILEGRVLHPDDPNRGRWLRHDVDAFCGEVWKRADELVPLAKLGELPTRGNRHNVLLSVITTAAYQILVERGVSRDHAITLVGDVGWRVYARMLGVVSWPIRITTRDPQRRMERTLRALMVFPFSAPGGLGYEVEVWSEPGRFYTHWTHCPPHTFVRRLVRVSGDRGELEAFRRSWCLYDWHGADLLAGDGEQGHYARPRTLSHGDPVCDMCWHTRT